MKAQMHISTLNHQMHHHNKKMTAYWVKTMPMWDLLYKTCAYFITEGGGDEATKLRCKSSHYIS